MPLKGAAVEVADFSASTTTSSAGAYALDVIVPSGPYAGVAIRANHRNYKAQSKPLGSGNPQVVDFTLAVKGTTIKVIVKHGGRGVAKAKVYFRGVKYKMTIKKAGYKTKRFKVTSRMIGTTWACSRFEGSLRIRARSAGSARTQLSSMMPRSTRRFVLAWASGASSRPPATGSAALTSRATPSKRAAPAVSDRAERERAARRLGCRSAGGVVRSRRMYSGYHRSAGGAAIAGHRRPTPRRGGSRLLVAVP